MSTRTPVGSVPLLGHSRTCKQEASQRRLVHTRRWRIVAPVPVDPSRLQSRRGAVEGPARGASGVAVNLTSEGTGGTPSPPGLPGRGRRASMGAEGGLTMSGAAKGARVMQQVKAMKTRWAIKRQARLSDLKKSWGTQLQAQKT